MFPRDYAKTGKKISKNKKIYSPSKPSGDFAIKKNNKKVRSQKPSVRRSAGIKFKIKHHIRIRYLLLVIFGYLLVAYYQPLRAGYWQIKTFTGNLCNRVYAALTVSSAPQQILQIKFYPPRVTSGNNNSSINED